MSFPYGVSRNGSTVNPACVPHCYPAKFIEKKCETAVLTSTQGSVITKKYSKMLRSPVVAIIFEALLFAKHCTGYWINMPHNSLESMHHLVNAPGEEWNLGSNPGLFKARVSVFLLQHTAMAWLN